MAMLVSSITDFVFLPHATIGADFNSNGHAGVSLTARLRTWRCNLVDIAETIRYKSRCNEALLSEQ
jgi:hypothetical protein